MRICARFSARLIALVAFFGVVDLAAEAAARGAVLTSFAAERVRATLLTEAALVASPRPFLLALAAAGGTPVLLRAAPDLAVGGLRAAALLDPTAAFEFILLALCLPVPVRAVTAAALFNFGSTAPLAVFVFDFPAPGRAACREAAFALDGFTVFLTDAISSGLLFCPALETGRVINGGKHVRRSENAAFVSWKDAKRVTPIR